MGSGEGSHRLTRRWLLALLMFALAVRVGWGLRQPGDKAAMQRLNLPDQIEYLDLAENLLHTNTLSFYDARFGDQVYAYRMPGYPLFLAALDASPRAIRLAQALIDTLTVLGVCLLARRWLSEFASLLAAAIVAVNPYLIYFSGLILSETLYTAMLVWGMVLLAGSSTAKPETFPLSLRRFLAGALVLALGIHVRPSGLGLPMLLGLAALILNRPLPSAYDPQAAPRWRVPVLSTMLLLTVLVLLPWVLRNHQRLEAWIWTTTNSGITLYDGFHPGATGASDQSFLKQLPELKRMNEVQRSAYLSDLARQWIQENPRQAAELAVVKAGRTWSPVPLSQDYGGRTLYRLAGLIYSVPLFVLVALGLWWSPLSRSAKTFLLMPAIYFTAIHALSVGSLRYRLPADAPMAILAAGCLASQTPVRWRRVETDEELNH